MEVLGLVFDTAGTIMIAYMALKVHHTVIKEHKIDQVVFQRMRREQIIGIIGVALVVVGFILQLISKTV